MKDSGPWMLEPPIAALLIGLIIANVMPFPKWMDSGFRVEYYIKTGIVLLGATFPINLLVSAGPVALFQATVISLYYMPDHLLCGDKGLRTR